MSASGKIGGASSDLAAGVLRDAVLLSRPNLLQLLDSGQLAGSRGWVQGSSNTAEKDNSYRRLLPRLTTVAVAVVLTTALTGAARELTSCDR